MPSHSFTLPAGSADWGYISFNGIDAYTRVTSGNLAVGRRSPTIERMRGFAVFDLTGFVGDFFILNTLDSVSLDYTIFSASATDYYAAWSGFYDLGNPTDSSFWDALDPNNADASKQLTVNTTGTKTVVFDDLNFIGSQIGGILKFMFAVPDDNDGQNDFIAFTRNAGLTLTFNWTGPFVFPGSGGSSIVVPTAAQIAAYGGFS